ncbi:MAG: Hpt domain-containing protein, partial [Methylomonas sp.]
MAIDMSQFHQVFFEESFEGLDAMESGLLNLDIGDMNADEINTIFRAAHSVKGGSGTFGFTAVSDFTHAMETLLDEMRDGRRQVTQAAVNVLLGSVDCLREMLQAIQNGGEIDNQGVAEHKAALEHELQGIADGIGEPQAITDPVAENIAASSQASAELQNAGWIIAFSPHLNMLKTGNEPVRMFRELATLGDLTAAVDLQGLPDLYELDPEECHLSWKLEVRGNIAASDIDEIFDWVEDDCDLSKQPIYLT